MPVPGTEAPAATGAISTGGGAPAAEPTAASAEPVAAEPAAAEPAAAEPAFGAADSFGWDEWDGEGGTLPDHVQDWYGKFNDRFTDEREKLALSSTEAMAQIQQESDHWKRVYASQFDDTEDPRIAELTQASETAAAEHKQATETWSAEKQGYEDVMEQSADQYIGLIKEMFKAQLEGMTPAQMAVVTGMLDTFDLHNALTLAQSGDAALAEASKLEKAGWSEDAIVRVINAEYSPAKAAAAATVDAKAKQAARRPKTHQVVAGAQPTQTSSPPRSQDIQKLSRTGRLGLAARRAMAADKR